MAAYSNTCRCEEDYAGILVEVIKKPYISGLTGKIKLFSRH